MSNKKASTVVPVPRPLSMRGLSLTIFTERYAWAGEMWAQACNRVAQANSKAESNGKVAIFAGRFEEQLLSGKFMPGGRFWYGSGRKVQQTMNCYVAPVEDSIEGWGKLMADVSTISARGGGVGVNFSPIRPRGYSISGMGGTTTGAVSLMKIVNSIGEEIKDGGGAHGMGFSDPALFGWPDDLVELRLEADGKSVLHDGFDQFLARDRGQSRRHAFQRGILLFGGQRVDP